MKRELAYKIISLITLVSLLFTLLPCTALAQGQVQPDLDISYSERGLEVIEVKLTNRTINPDGSISADLALVAKTSLTYGLLLSVENGTVSGPVIERLLMVQNRAIPLAGKSTLELGRVTFSPGAHLKIRLNKVELVPGDASMLLGLDLVTAFLLFTGIGHLPTKSADLLPGIAELFLQLLNNIGFDGALFTTQLQREDYIGAFRTLASMLVSAPALFANFLLSEYGINVAAETIRDFGIRIGRILPIIGVWPVVRDLIRRPRAVQVDIRATGPTGANVDVVLVIDRSGSMSGQKILDAKTAAKLFVDLMHDGDMIGVVSFSSNATVNYGLTTIASVKDDAKNAIDAISAGGMTSIGAGLQKGGDELTNEGDPTHPWAIVLLSNGGENTAPWVEDVLPNIKAAGIVVYTIGLGSGTNEALLQDIAAQTGGIYTFAPTSDQLTAIYNRLAGRIAGQQLVTSGQGSAAPGETDTQTALVGTREATFTITWANAGVDLDLTLVSPSSRVIDPTVAGSDPDIEYLESESHEFYRLISPETGLWTLQIHLPSSAQDTINYSFAVTVLSDLKLEAFTSADVILPGEPVLLSAMLFDNQGTITGANVVATVQPTGATITLFDDGAHSDGDADDGVYAATFDDTSTVGTYSFCVQASGPGFTRQVEVTLSVSTDAQPSVDLWIAKTGPSEAQAGDDITYTIVYGNNGPNGVVSAQIEDILPPNTTFVSSTLGPPTPVSANTVRWDVGAIPAQTDRSFSITVRIEPTTASGVSITNQIAIQPVGVVDDLAAGNNESTTTTTTTTPTPAPEPVGGIIVPVNKLELVAPWLGLAALASLAALTVALVKRRRA